MEIDGKIYTSDLIIYPGRIDPSWWRKTGHRLSLEDLHGILEEEFEVLVVGTGYWGMMKVDKEVIGHADAAHFDLIIEKTAKAVERFNNLFYRKKTIGVFHLTC